MYSGWRCPLINPVCRVVESLPVELVSFNGSKLVDSRLIAQEIEIEHRALMQLIVRYKNDIESKFGQLTFKMEVAKSRNGAGNPSKYTFLTEDQTFFVVSLSRNTYVSNGSI